MEEAEDLRRLRFVSGHGFSRAEMSSKNFGFSRCWLQAAAKAVCFSAFVFGIAEAMP